MINKSTLPKNWEIVKHSEIADINPKLPFEKIEDETEVSFIPMKNVEERNNIVHLTEFRKYKDVRKGYTPFTNGDVIFAKITPCMENGKCAVVRNLKNEIGFGSTEFHVSRSKGKILPEFIFYYIVQEQFRRVAEHNMTGSVGQKRVPTLFFQDFEIPLPLFAEQERIVAKIEELFSELDAGTESLKRAQQQLKIYRQAVLKYAFEGRLTNEDLNDGELPNGWKWEKLSELTEKIADGPFGSNLKSVDYVEEGVRVIRLENIGVLEFKDEYKTFVTEEKYSTISKHTVTKGDIIFSSFIANEIRVTILPNFIEKAINKADCFCIRTSENTINRKYLVFFLASKTQYNQLINKVHGATRPRINTKQLKASLIPICSLAEQHRVVEEIESRLSVCDKLEETINESLQQAESLRQSILKKAFEGRLVAAEEKPVYQPNNIKFYQIQVLAFMLIYFRHKGFRFAEMTSAKNTYLLNKIYGIPIYDNYKRWHLGPYSAEIKQTINNKTYFRKNDYNGIEVLNEEKLFKYSNPYQQKIEDAVNELAEIYSSFTDPKTRAHKIELLATVCKVIEDIQTTELAAVRQSMAEWKISLKDKKFNDKAQKFGEVETAKCIEFIKGKGWDKKLII